MTKHARSCGETRGGSLDLETRCMQENAERQRGEPDTKSNEFSKLLGGTGGGSLDIETR